MQNDLQAELLPWRGPPEVLQRLTRSGWLRSIHYCEQVDSTNRLAKQMMLAGGAALPMLLVAKRQTAGRGRLGRTWYSDAGTLTITIAMSSEALRQPLARLSQLSLVTGLALCDVVAEVIDPVAVKLKWPNDVYVEGRKLAGILIESVGDRGEGIIIGIGLNVGTDFSKAPADVQVRATAVSEFTKVPVPTFSLLPDLIDALHARIVKWVDDPHATKQDYDAVCLLRGRRVSIAQGNLQIVGRCVGIDVDGQLRVDVDGDTVRVHSGEVLSWDGI
ncbi:MAG: biotin--[acetyl-CoA-carboxylase] ligase [Pirellulaceae bacterium]